MHLLIFCSSIPPSTCTNERTNERASQGHKGVVLLCLRFNLQTKSLALSFLLFACEIAGKCMLSALSVQQYAKPGRARPTRGGLNERSSKASTSQPASKAFSLAKQAKSQSLSNQIGI